MKLALYLLTLTACFAQSVPSKSKTPTLDETMRLIVGKINSNQTHVFGVTYGDASTDRDVCVLHFKVFDNSLTESWVTTNFHDAEKVTVSESPLHGSIVQIVTVQLQTGKTTQTKWLLLKDNNGKVFDVNSTEMILFDKELAYRLRNAMQHALALCGGGRKDPF